MFDSLLIANRGEIACRIIRTARRLGIRTIAVYSEADVDALHVEQADDAVFIGAAPATASYLNVETLIEAIAASGAAAVHPGYGFLSESADFAKAVAATGAAFVGPPESAIRAMGSKIEAKRLVAAAGAPVVPGYHGTDQTPATLARMAGEIGFPVLIKAALGGGGRGMRIVAAAGEFDAALTAAKRESLAAFGDDAVLLERYLSRPKHIEIQILADAAGKTLSLYERDCSVQRRHQKVIEEAPAPTVDAALRQAIGGAAVQAARSVGYVGAGTVEFIVEGDRFYFMEMNTRLQVEHPVTEAILGLDLVEWQLRIVAGEPLGFEQADLAIDGHAVEARIYAENPRRRFLPSTGTLHCFSFPEDVRVDAGVQRGSTVSVYYDPMLAKVIAHASERRQAIAALRDALQRSAIAGVEHNAGWLATALAHPQFFAGDYTTGFADEAAEDLVVDADPIATAAACVASVLAGRGEDPWSRTDGFQLNLPWELVLRARRGRTPIDVRLHIPRDPPDGFVVDGPEGQVRVTNATFADGLLQARFDGRPVDVRIVRGGSDIYAMHRAGTERLTIIEPDAGSFGHVEERSGRVAAPMPGRIIAVNVAVGDRVRAGDVLVVLEAMKMEHSLRATTAGKVAAVYCAAGARVTEGEEVASVDPL